MTKCVEGLKLVVGDHLVLIQCWAHKLHLVSNTWIRQMPELNEAVSMTKSVFLHTRKRKHLYAAFLQVQRGEKCPLFPMPVVTRWNSWFESAFYIAEYFMDIVAFCKTKEIRNIENAGIVYFATLTVSQAQVLHCKAVFVKDHAQHLVDLITKLEGSSFPNAHTLHKNLKNFKNSFDNI